MRIINNSYFNYPAFKVKTRQEVAEEYGICPKTLNRWFKKADIYIPSGLLWIN